MLVHEFDELMEQAPFHPFRIDTADGRSVLVKSPEFAWHPPAGRTVFVASGRVDDRVHIIDLQLVTRFTVEQPARRGGDGKPKRRPEH